jgi:hypothetical protein
MKLTDDELRECHRAWQGMKPTVRITFALAELVERRAADLTREEIEALRGCSVHCLDARQLELATHALDKVIARGDPKGALAAQDSDE